MWDLINKPMECKGTRPGILLKRQNQVSHFGGTHDLGGPIAGTSLPGVSRAAGRRKLKWPGPDPAWVGSLEGAICWEGFLLGKVVLNVLKRSPCTTIAGILRSWFCRPYLIPLDIGHNSPMHCNIRKH